MDFAVERYASNGSSDPSVAYSPPSVFVFPPPSGRIVAPESQTFRAAGPSSVHLIGVSGMLSVRVAHLLLSHA